MKDRVRFGVVSVEGEGEGSEGGGGDGGGGSVGVPEELLLLKRMKRRVSERREGEK